MAKQTIDIAELIAQATAKGIEVTGVNSAITVEHSVGVSKKTGKAFSGYRIKLGNAFPLYVSDGAMATLVSDAAIKALRDAYARQAKRDVAV